LSLMLRRGIEALVVAALVVAMVAVLPAVAEAQSIATSQEARDANGGAERSVVVVRAGDSLWSISAERLGVGATPQQVAEGAERIYALNRDQIGPDPNLIFAGQKLSLPAMGSAEAPRPDAKATQPAVREGAATAAAASPKGDSASYATRTEKAPAVGSEAPSLPKVTDAAPAVPAARQVASEDSPTNGSPFAPLLRDARSVATSAASAVDESLLKAVRAAADERRTLGWVILALTVLVGVLMAWRLPMRRTTRRDAERWGMPTDYYYGDGGSYTSESATLDKSTAKPEESGEQLAEQLTPAAHHSEALLGEDLQEHLHHHERSPAGVTEAPPNGGPPNGGPPNGGVQAARRRESVV
jgi:nucleoid-associated protein YgaU